MGRTYKTMQGRSIDMDKLRAQNELTPAVGNMKVNARGDEIGQGGKITRTREQVMSTYYENNPKATPDGESNNQQTVKKSPQNPPSQTLKIEDTPVSEVVQETQVEEPMEEVKQEVNPEQAEEQVLDKGVEAVKKARARRRGISDATGGN